MNITMYGAGYVGLVTGASLADLGHNVLCMDVDTQRVAKLLAGQSPIYEPGLDALIQKNVAEKRLDFTTDPLRAVAHGSCQFIAVGTPPDEDGSADLQYVLAVAKTIGQYRDENCVIVDKSTVPVGTAEKVKATLQAALTERGKADLMLSVVSNPEFLKEGSALPDFNEPERIVIGADSPEAFRVMRAVYAPLTARGAPLLEMDVRSAELCKYAANAMLATRISFMNELSQIAERLGADIELVRQGMALDSRIGPKFLFPGPGYGGSCFPKDLRALSRNAHQLDYEPRILNAVESVNAAQKRVLFEKIARYFNSELAGKRIALWGLAFKPNTDDMREASSRVLMESLFEAGTYVQAYDPVAMPETARLYPDMPLLSLSKTAMAALKGADALVIVTEWPEFKKADLSVVKTELNNPVLFDGRNLFEPLEMAKQGFYYACLGRPIVQGAL